MPIPCTSSSMWWARIKYIDNLEDYVPINQLSECGENMQKTKSFQPQHFDDFVPEKYYLVQTDKFNLYEDGTQNIYYALICNLAESEETMKKYIKKIEQDSTEIYGMFQDIEENFVNDIKKTTVTSIGCFSFDRKRCPLLSLLFELESFFSELEKSVEKQLVSVMFSVKTIKKRLLTNICVFNEGLNNPDLNLVGPLVEEFFFPFEEFKVNLGSAVINTSKIVRELCNLVENSQKEKIALHPRCTQKVLKMLFLIRSNLNFFKKVELEAIYFHCSFRFLRAQLTDIYYPNIEPYAEISSETDESDFE